MGYRRTGSAIYFFLPAFFFGAASAAAFFLAGGRFDAGRFFAPPDFMVAGFLAAAFFLAGAFFFLVATGDPSETVFEHYGLSKSFLSTRIHRQCAIDYFTLPYDILVARAVAYTTYSRSGR